MERSKAGSSDGLSLPDQNIIIIELEELKNHPPFPTDPNRCLLYEGQSYLYKNLFPTGEYTNFYPSSWWMGMYANMPE